MYNLNYLFREFDPENIQKLPTNKKDKYRKRLIAMFLIKSYYDGMKNVKLQRDKHYIKNTKDYFKFCIFWTFPLSLVVYYLLFRGVYELRSFYFNPQKISVWVKFPIAYSLSCLFLMKYWYAYIYMPEIYQIATSNI
jgi:hypothetical protein